MTHHLGRATLGMMLLAVLSCTNETVTGTEVRDASDLRLLHVAAGAPPLAATQATFWAVKGRESGVDLHYRPAAGSTDSTRFLEFRLGPGSLDRRPDGSLIAVGDSVLITLQVTDARHLVIDYQPSGLRFSADDKPRLKMYYSFCGDDLNYDGRVDAGDDAIANSLSIWQQEGVGQPWYRLASVVTKGTKEVNAQISGFTGYAIMY